MSGWDGAAVVATAFTYATTLCAAGAVFFPLYSRGLLDDAQHARLSRLIQGLLIASAIASAAKIMALMGSMSGEFSGMVDGEFAGMILGAGEGRATAARMAGLVLMALGAGAKRAPVAIIGAIGAATSFAWTGHIHAMAPNGLPTVLLGLHLLCAAFWLGALAPLALVARDGKPAQLAAVAARFGRTALGLVAVLVAAGASLLWMVILRSTDFLGSLYGRLMLAKLLAVALLLSLAAVNKLLLTPAMCANHAKARSRFRRSLQAEMILGGVILIITAAFTTLAGPP